MPLHRILRCSFCICIAADVYKRQNGTLTVTPGLILVAANSTNRAYGAANPTFTATYSGFVNGDGTNVLVGSPSLTTSAVTNSPVGGYAIIRCV